MKNFAQIRESMGLTGNKTRAASNTTPDLTYTYHPPGGGYQESIVVELNSGVHVTIYQTSWDGTVDIPDLDNETVSVGPYCLHLTAGVGRWFYEVVGDGTLAPVTDYGNMSERALKTIKTFIGIIGKHLM